MGFVSHRLNAVELNIVDVTSIELRLAIQLKPPSGWGVARWTRPRRKRGLINVLVINLNIINVYGNVDWITWLTINVSKPIDLVVSNNSIVFFQVM